MGRFLQVAKLLLGQLALAAEIHRQLLLCCIQSPNTSHLDHLFLQPAKANLQRKLLLGFEIRETLRFNARDVWASGSGMVHYAGYVDAYGVGLSRVDFAFGGVMVSVVHLLPL
jgi:hypothetical protein